MDLEEWLEYGYAQGWCGPTVCEPHDGLPTSEEEDADYENGGDPCIHIIRLYEDKGVKNAVEQNHAPSVWRASNRGYKIEETKEEEN